MIVPTRALKEGTLAEAQEEVEAAVVENATVAEKSDISRATAPSRGVTAVETTALSAVEAEARKLGESKA